MHDGGYDEDREQEEEEEGGWGAGDALDDQVEAQTYHHHHHEQRVRQRQHLRQPQLGETMFIVNKNGHLYGLMVTIQVIERLCGLTMS